MYKCALVDIILTEWHFIRGKKKNTNTLTKKTTHKTAYAYTCPENRYIKTVDMTEVKW